MKTYVELLKLIIEGVSHVVRSVKEAERKQEIEAIKSDVYRAWGAKFGELREQRSGTANVSGTQTQRNTDTKP